jgi:hypothetical protein
MEVRFQTTVHIHPKLRAMIETEVLDLLLSIQLFGGGQSEDAAHGSGPTSSRPDSVVGSRIWRFGGIVRK